MFRAPRSAPRSAALALSLLLCVSMAPAPFGARAESAPKRDNSSRAFEELSQRRNPGVVIDDDEEDAGEAEETPAAPARPAPMKRAEPSRPERRPPQSVARVSERRQRALDRLYTEMGRAGPEESAALADAVRSIWARSGSDSADYMMRRASAALAAGQGEAGARLLDATIAIAPDWAFAYLRRGVQRAQQDDVSGAAADFERAARIDPRNFDALDLLGGMRLKEGAKAGALEAFRRSLAARPGRAEIEQQIDRLKPEVEGRDI